MMHIIINTENILKPVRVFFLISCVLTLAACTTYRTSQQTRDYWYPNDSYHSTLTLEQLEDLGKAGSDEALIDLAIRYMSGDRVERNQSFGIEILEDISSRGDPRAQYFLGSAYLLEAGVPLSHKDAIHWLEKSANGGYDLGQYWYAYMLSRGQGVEAVDWEAAIPWFRKAAVQGHTDAQFSLGEAYDSCKGGLDRDFSEAAKWYRKAFVEGKSILANFNLRRLIDLGLIEWQEGDPGVRPTKFEEIGDDYYQPCPDGQKDPIFN